MITRQTITNNIVTYLNWLLTNQANIISYGTGESALSIIPIIQGSQNAPIPTGIYLTVNQPYGEILFDSTSANETDVSGNLSKYNHYKCVVSLYETKGNGEYLKLIKNLNNMQSCINKQKTLNFSFGWFEELQAIPDLTDEQWESRFLMEAQVYYYEVIKEKTGYISTVEITEDYS